MFSISQPIVYPLAWLKLHDQHGYSWRSSRTKWARDPWGTCWQKYKQVLPLYSYDLRPCKTRYDCSIEPELCWVVTKVIGCRWSVSLLKDTELVVQTRTSLTVWAPSIRFWLLVFETRCNALSSLTPDSSQHDILQTERFVSRSTRASWSACLSSKRHVRRRGPAPARHKATICSNQRVRTECRSKRIRSVIPIDKNTDLMDVQSSADREGHYDYHTAAIPVTTLQCAAPCQMVARA